MAMYWAIIGVLADSDMPGSLEIWKTGGKVADKSRRTYPKFCCRQKPSFPYSLDPEHLKRETLPSMNLPILYIKPGCPWCDEVVDYLERKGIEIRIVVVSGNPEAMREMVALSGQSKAPTMDWHGEVLADFGVDELVPFLKQRGM
jgi:glutaredoxin 3